tara:strand:+ start:286 stop:672 length:387 start_codon:yes stop_codon:yes gene_type:complete
MNSNINKSSNKSFGVVFFLLFLLIGMYPLLNNGNIRILFIIISFIFLILGLLNSKILTPFNNIWFKFGIILGQIISPIIMLMIFFTIVTPIGYIMRFMGKDILDLKFKKQNTYWIEKSGPKSKMKNQF